MTILTRSLHGFSIQSIRAWLKGHFLTEPIPLSEASSPPPSTHVQPLPANIMSLSLALWHLQCFTEDVLIQLWLVSNLDYKL